MSGLTVPYGYGSKRVDIDQLDNFETWSKLHPEFKRRVKAMFVAANGHVGVGTGWRSSDVQKAVFLQRHVVSSSGKIRWDGKSWALKPGMAPAAPPGMSFHEGVNNGMAMAIDVVGDVAWADDNAAQFGLVEFRAVNHEPWHFQCAELPHGFSSWVNAGRPQPKDLSGSSRPPQPTPTPTPSKTRPQLKLGDRGPDVAAMQALLIRAGAMVDKASNQDGVFGPGTQGALKSFQTSRQLAADGVCGPKTWQALGG